MKSDIIILAGGLGTRLRSVVQDMPKPMAPVNGRPFLDIILERISPEICSKLVLSIGYLGEQVQEYLGNEYQGIPIEYAVENEPLGKGGGIKLALEKCSSDQVFILNGDTFFVVDLEELRREHLTEENDLTLALKEMTNPDRYGTVELLNKRIIRFNEKIEGLEQGVINGGVYCINRALIIDFPQASKFSFEQEILEKKLQDWKMGAFLSEGLFIDIGIPADYERAASIFS
ncbi:NTP transferase domain-containing protein [bacterium]|nr:NTP transferase domain-containing protein [bacterium]